MNEYLLNVLTNLKSLIFIIDIIFALCLFLLSFSTLIDWIEYGYEKDEMKRAIKVIKICALVTVVLTSIIILLP